MQFGLVGKSLSHSFSKQYFETKFRELNLLGYEYHNFELNSIDEIKTLLKTHPNLRGFNVTIPYKEAILPFLDSSDEESKQIGAVNCIKIINNKLLGYNADAYGFAQSIKPFLDKNHERALILGTGGASKAVAHVLRKIGLEVFFASSQSNKINNNLLYSEINERMMHAFKLIVNTTPLGTFPHINECPYIPYQSITPLHLVYDLIYNPTETLFLQKAKQQGAIVVNGLSMLQLQAEKSWEIWNS